MSRLHVDLLSVTVIGDFGGGFTFTGVKSRELREIMLDVTYLFKSTVRNMSHVNHVNLERFHNMASNNRD